MADPEIWKALIETGNPYVQQERQQKGLMGMMLLQEKQREMEDTQKLRDLYSSGRNVSPQDVMAISPELGIKLQQAGNQSYLQQLQAQDLVTKQNESQSKLYAQHISPIAQDYFDDIKKGMPEQQAEYKFRTAVGQAQADIEQRFGMRPQADFTKFTPMQIAQRAHSLGVDIPHLKEIEQQQQNQLAIQQKQTPGAGELQQEYVLAPDGVTWMPKPNPYKQPRQGMSTGAGPSPYPEQAPYQFTAPSGQKIMAYDLGSAAQAAQQLPEGADKEAASKWLDEQWSGMRNPQKPKTKQELEVETAAAKKKAELAVEGEHEAEQQLTTIKALDAQNVESLIDKSFHSKPEALAKGEYGLSGMAGMPTEANTAYKDLVVIEAQMRDMAKAIVGAGPISEGEQKIIKDALGGVSTPGDATSRKSAYRKFVEMAKAKISKYPHLAQQMKAIDEMSSKQSAAPSSQPSGASLKIGDIDEGMEYLGGDPNSESSWKKVK